MGKEDVDGYMGVNIVWKFICDKLMVIRGNFIKEELLNIEIDKIIY